MNNAPLLQVMAWCPFGVKPSADFLLLIRSYSLKTISDAVW